MDQQNENACIPKHADDCMETWLSDSQRLTMLPSRVGDSDGPGFSCADTGEMDSCFRVLEQMQVAQYLSNKESLCHLVSNQLIALTGAVACAFSSYDEQAHVLINQNVVAGKRMLDLFVQVLGKGMVGMRTPLTGAMIQEMFDQRIKVHQSLTEATNGEISHNMARVFQKVTGMHRLMGVSFVMGNHLEGAALIAFREDQRIPSHEMIQLYATSTAGMMKWKHQEE